MTKQEAFDRYENARQAQVNAQAKWNVHRAHFPPCSRAKVLLDARESLDNAHEELVSARNAFFASVRSH
jgi:hypothetical protein